METFIVIVTAKPGHDAEVAQFYQDLEPLLQEAKGFQGRQIFQAKTGTMVDAVKKIYSAEELAKHPEPPHEDPGTNFIVIEHWDSVDDRMAYSKGASAGRNQALIPHLLPDHSHEFYKELSAG